MDLHIQKVADRMDEKRGAGQSLDLSLHRWYTKWGQVTSGMADKIKRVIDKLFPDRLKKK